MPLQPIHRGTHQTIEWTILDPDGSPHEFLTGESAKIGFGSVTPFGTAEALVKDTTVPGEGSVTVGSPVATFYLLPADGDSLPASSYQVEVYLIEAGGHVRRMSECGTISVQGRIIANP